MLQTLTTELGMTGGLLVAVTLTLSMLAWMPAIAGIASSGRHWSVKVLATFTLILFPPSALAVLALIVFRNAREQAAHEAPKEAEAHAGPSSSKAGGLVSKDLTLMKACCAVDAPSSP